MMSQKLNTATKSAFRLLYMLLITFLATGASNLNGQDGLIAYEGFDYPADAGLELNNGGTGWDAQGWVWRSNFDGKGSIIFAAAYIEAGSLTYGELSTTGNHLHLYGDLGSIEMGRRLAEVIPGTAGTSTYISFIGQRVGPPADTVNKPNGDPWDNPDTTDVVETYPWGDNLYPRGTSLRFFNSDNGEKFQIGNYSNQDLNEWSVFAGGSRPSGVLYTELAFVVMKINHKGDETVADDIIFWVNPDLSAGEDIGAAQVVNLDAVEVNDDTAIVDLSNLSWISPWAGGASGDREWAEMLMDELRIGTTWESVTPTGGVVEPTRIIGLSGSLEFGDVTVGETPTATLSIGNTGNEALTVSGITYPDGFSGDWSSGSIDAGASQDVTVTFTPAAVQSYSGDITVESDATSGASTIAVSGNGVQEQATEWAGFAIVNEGGDVDTGSFLGWINVADAPLILSYSLNTYLYMEESFVSDAGAWGYLFNQSTDAPMGGDSTWAGYTVLGTQDVDTKRFIGWINILQAPYIFSYSFSYWIYMPEDFVAPAGSWGYFFNRN